MKKSKKPWIDPANLNTTQKFLIALGLVGLAFVIMLILMPPAQHNESTPASSYNITGGAVIVASNHPTNEQEFNELQKQGVKTTEPEAMR